MKLNNRHVLQIIQVYAPTSSYSDDKVETFYNEVQKLHDNGKAHYKIIMGDFNAKVASNQSNDSFVETFRHGKRNERGDRLVEFAEINNLCIMNSFFKKNKSRKWTWRGPNGTTNEIDFILANKARLFQDISVLNKFKTGSDHRLVRGCIKINAKVERWKLMKKQVATRSSPCLIKWTPVSDRLLMARFSHRHGHMTVIVTYAPTEDASDEEKDMFYDQLTSAVSQVTPQDILIFLGDMNAVTGADRLGYKSIIGGFGSGVVNDNSHWLLSLCASSGLAVTGSWFRQRNMHRWTWYSNDGFTRKEIDHILVRSWPRQVLQSLPWI